MGSIADLLNRRVYLDANIFIYALEDLNPWNEQAKAILRAVDERTISAVTSELTLAECLAKPLKDDLKPLVDVYLNAIQQRPNLATVPVSREILIAAASIRSTSQLKLPDAIHLATARVQACELFLTNDRQFSTLQDVRYVLISTLSPPETRLG